MGMMNKKLMAFVLIVMMMSVNALAFATFSVDESTLTVGVQIEDYDVALAAPSLAAETITGVSANGIEWFGSDVLTEMNSLVADASDKTMKLLEFRGFNPTSYTDAQLSAGIELSFSREFADGDVIVVLTGIRAEQGGMEWYPARASVSNGKLIVQSDEAVASKIAASSDGCFTILRAE